MRRSDIFENFVKIAEEKGLISKASPESVKKELEETGRADSLSIDDISKLYNVKPSAPEDAKYDRNIAERAHPSPLVIAPSYDKLNGLVENINERQDILLHIVNKTTNGYIVQRKYAERELTLALVRVGNDMDNRGHQDLMSLADTCLKQSGPAAFKKQAQLQVIIPLIAALVGGLYAKQHLRFHSEGFARDYQKATTELDDLISSNSNLGVGYQYTPELVSMVNDTKNKLNELNTSYQALLPELDKIEAPKVGSEIVAISQQPQTHEALHALQDFKKTVQKIYPFLLQVTKNFSNEDFKQRHIADKGFLTNLVDSTEGLHGGKGLIADDFDDAAHALQTVLYDVANIEKSMVGSENAAQNTAEQLQATNTQTNSSEVAKSPVSEDNVPGTQVRQVQTNPIEEEAGNIEKELSQFPDLETNI